MKRICTCTVLGSVLIASAPTAQTVIHQFDGAAGYDFLGMSVRGAGDVDADGRADVVVGALGYNSLGGRAIVYSGRTGAVLHTFAAPGFTSANGAGDVDGDGHADVIVGSIADATFGPSTGRAVVYSGATGASLYVFTGSAARDYFGIDVASAGDVDGDGRADVIVGASQSSSTPDTGYARVLSGASGAVLFQLSGDSVGDAFGESVDGAGDVDGDGRGDLLVGAPRDDNVASEGGMARVFSGSTGAVLYQVDGAASYDGVGRAVAGAGDVNADGFDDFLLGVSGDGTAGAYAGSVRVYSGLDGTPLYVFYGDASGSALGAAVGAAGDVNGDGFDDIVAGAGGGVNQVRVWSGRDGSVVYTVTGGANLGTSVDIAGDVDGDCFADVIAGDPVFTAMPSPETGRVFIYSGVAAGPGTSYCFGDGSGTDCPCGNVGCAGRGCDNSLATGGGHLNGTGVASVAQDTVTLRGAGLPPSVPALFFQGTAQLNGGLGSPLGDGLRCVAGSVVRLGTRNASNGVVSFGFGVAGDPSISQQGSIPAAGGTREYQVWYRNAAAFCTSATFNFTNGVRIVWTM